MIVRVYRLSMNGKNISQQSLPHAQRLSLSGTKVDSRRRLPSISAATARSPALHILKQSYRLCLDLTLYRVPRARSRLVPAVGVVASPAER
jgi:hypothetical protein